MALRKHVLVTLLASLPLVGLVAAATVSRARLLSWVGVAATLEGKGGESSASSVVLTVDTIEVEAGPSFTTRRTYSVNAKRAAELSFPRAGRLESIRVEPGESVDRDAILAELDDPGQGRRLSAPFEGVVARILTSEGATVSPQVPILRLVQRSALEAWIGVPTEVAEELEEEATHSLQIGAESYEATLSSVLLDVDARTRTRMAILEFDEETSRQLLPGESVAWELEREVASEGFWLPMTALTREIRGLWSVFVVERDAEGIERVSRRSVEVLHLGGERAWVRGTLEDGDRVVADGTLRVVPGQRVTTRDAGGAAS